MFLRYNNCRSIDDLRKVAKRRIPRALYEYIQGYADDGYTAARNQHDMNNFELCPRALVDVSKVELSTKLFGVEHSSPLILAPTALSRMFHSSGEFSVVNAAKTHRAVYTLSTLSSVSLEEVARVDTEKWFQVYCYKDRSLTENMVLRAKQAGYKALCLTIDAQIPGNRELDIKNGLTIPPRLTITNIANTILHFRWLLSTAFSPKISFANIPAEYAKQRKGGALLQYVSDQLDTTLSWNHVRWLREIWEGPLILKGILNPLDVRRAVNVGVDGIVVSNHGGRQLDGVSSTISMLPRMVEAADGQLDIIADSGFRRGTDVLKALAMGASACMIGRPYLYGLAAGGEAGVSKALDILHKEIKTSLQLLGCSRLSELGSDFVRSVNSPTYHS